MPLKNKRQKKWSFRVALITGKLAGISVVCLGDYFEEN